MLSFKPEKVGTSVFLDGKRVGTIFAVKGGGFAYFPKGHNTHGEVFPTISAVKRSLAEQ